MPIFDYDCPTCEAKRKDLLVKKHDQIVECPLGCSLPMQKRFNYAPAVHGADSGMTKDSDVGEILDNTVDNLTGS